MSEPFVTAAEVAAITGVHYSMEDMARLETILPLVSAALRQEAFKAGYDIDAMISADETGSYAGTVKLVTADVAARAMRQSMEGDPMTQESQSAMGYTWSGTYSIPGGGIAAAIMRNDLKRLGLKRQRIRGIELYGSSY